MIEPLNDETAGAIRDFLASEDVGEILQMMIFSTCPIAHLFRDSGVGIPRKTELEQAWTMRWLFDLVLDHGPNWREVASKRLVSVRADLVAAAEAAKGAFSAS